MQSVFILMNLGPKFLVEKIDELLAKLFPVRLSTSEQDTIVDLPQTFG
jgi:hypothetical protein